MMSKMPPVSGSDRSCGSLPAGVQLTDSVQLVDGEEIALAVFEQAIDDRVEVQHGHDSSQVAGRLMQAAVVDGLVRRTGRDANLREDDAVAQLVGQNIEVLAVGPAGIDAAELVATQGGRKKRE
jgi:hypothetical protein